jgi:hypothetical protein
VESWIHALHLKNQELLTYGMAHHGEFLERAEQAVSKFSKLIEIHNTAEPCLTDSEAFGRLSRLNNLFEAYPNEAAPIRAVFVLTGAHGVGTAVKFLSNDTIGKCGFAIGINWTRLDSPAAGFNFDEGGMQVRSICVTRSCISRDSNQETLPYRRTALSGCDRALS